MTHQIFSFQLGKNVELNMSAARIDFRSLVDVALERQAFGPKEIVCKVLLMTSEDTPHKKRIAY